MIAFVLTGAEIPRSHVRFGVGLEGQELGAEAQATNETFLVCDGTEACAEAVPLPSFSTLPRAVDFAHAVAGTDAGAHVEVWRRDRHGSTSRVLTCRSSITVTEHWHDQSQRR